MSTLELPSFQTGGVDLGLRRAFYPLVGSTPRQMRALLALLGPMRSGRRFGAFTDWEIVWRYRHADDGGGRRICAVTVEVHATITSPRWAPPRTAPAQLVAAWKDYAAAIETHEQGHIAVAVATAEGIRTRLMALRTLPSKTALAHAAEAVAEEELREARAREMSYDQITCHGATQGVVFPSDQIDADAPGGAILGRQG